MKQKQFFIIAFFLCLYASLVMAEEDVDVALAVDSSSLEDDAAALYGTACEKIKPQEAKSSVRLRATDKASFEAVKDLSELNDFKNSANEHDFNVLVYNVVDNYVEDLAVRTIKQDELEICVEVTGYVKKNDIAIAISLIGEETPEDISASDLSKYELKTEKDEAQSENVSASTASSQIQDISLTQEYIETSDKTISETIPQKKLLYISPVEFFNNTSSETHKQILKEIFDKNDTFYLTENKDIADYVIKAKVMRAKIDPINSNTNRLQMVLSVGVKFTDNGASTIEHQNRFILFSSDDNEQEVAAKLMRKLLTKAGEQILNKVEADARRAENIKEASQIITPK